MQAVATSMKTRARTCVGCRSEAAPADLLRFATFGDPPALAPDINGRLGGRGVSIHPTKECFRIAAQRRGFQRSAPGMSPAEPLDIVALARAAVAQYEARADGLLLSARRTNGIAIGTDSVRDMLRSGSASLLILARGARNRAAELAELAVRASCPVLEHQTKVHLGRLLGRPEVGVVSISDSRIAAEVARALSRATALAEVE